MAKNKGLNRGGTLGQEGDLTNEGNSPPGAGGAVPETGPRGSMRDRLDHRDQEKQRGGIAREPSLEDEDKRDIQPTHQVD